MKTDQLKQQFDERIIPDETPKGIVSVHLVRYQFTIPYCQGKDVLDVACGVGYGTHYLSPSVHKITGVDLSEGAVRYANEHYSAKNVSFLNMNACNMNLPDQSFDTVCSFETIEHIPEPESFLKEIVRLIKKDGIFIVSTPFVLKTNSKPENPHHFIEWSLDDFSHLLGKYFSSVQLFAQKRKQSAVHRFLQKLDVFNLRTRLKLNFLNKALCQTTGTTSFGEMDIHDLEIVENDFKHALYTLAVCAGPGKG